MSTNYTPELYDTAKIEYDMKRAEGVPAHALNAHLNVFLESNGIASIDVRKEIIDRLISDDHIRQSWELVKQISLETTGVLFFKNIFEEAPGALQLFSFKDEVPLYESRKLKAHGLAVMTHVGYAVAGLRDINALVPVLARLGAKHNGKNITPEHFDLIGY